jgi:anti-sigma regulatory factor (Ser/Thr protein kinase)
MAEAASAAKTQFLATLSHEIRTPMTGVMGMAELLLSTPLNRQQHDYTQAMQRSGGMLLKLLNDALDLARIEAGRLELEPAPFSPRQLLEDVAQLEQGLAHAKGIRFELALADDLPAQLLGDAVRIKQILLNLANNALKFTEHGSVSLSAQRTADGLLFGISDTGPGIPEASQARLFQRFEQADGPQRAAGSGLGLAICRELVDMMGGSIELESRVGHGSTFRVRLPLAEPAEPAPLAAPLAAGGSHHLLLVEGRPPRADHRGHRPLRRPRRGARPRSGHGRIPAQAGQRRTTGWCAGPGHRLGERCHGLSRGRAPVLALAGRLWHHGRYGTGCRHGASLACNAVLAGMEARRGRPECFRQPC